LNKKSDLDISALGGVNTLIQKNPWNL